jgi:ATP-dependent RNA helicase HelY
VSLATEFAKGYSFAFDEFQTKAIDALQAGRSVLVCAPTGAGKTVVGEFAVWLALKTGGKAFYTTPLKALSNQKFGDFIARHGADNVGLLTGDNSINGEAPIVVMTTEVLRNMLYEGSPTLEGLSFVVMDEVHYLQDQYRGAVWEEVLIHSPAEIRIAALSATVSNAEEFGDWLRVIRGAVEVVIEDQRPVPLEHHYMIGDEILPTFADDAREHINPALKKRIPAVRRRQRGGRGFARHGDERRLVPSRLDVVDRLEEEGMLPAIYFIFSRNGCEAAVRSCVSANLRLTSPEEAERVDAYVKLRADVLPQDDLDVLGYSEWVEGLRRGIGAHHAGLIPLFKETVEELFEQGLIKVVFATETLSLGINMPAKTVVIERLVKFTGERHELMTPGEYTQLTGRAGRRGIDPIGHAIVLYQRDVPLEKVASLASTRIYPLRSSFRPSYNMAVNLVRRYPVEEAVRLLNLSFAQFLADRSVAQMARRIERNREALEGYRKNLSCDRGDFASYWALVRGARAAEKERTSRSSRVEAAERALTKLRPGDVVRLGRSGGGVVAIVVERRRKGGHSYPTIVTAKGHARRLVPRDAASGLTVIGRVQLPHRDADTPAHRRDIARRLEKFVPPDDLPVQAERDLPRGLDDEITGHPVHGCPERADHERWALRVDDIEAETAAMERRVGQRTGSISRTFERVLEILRRFDYVEADRLTAKGEMLCRIYNEGDLLVAEAIEQQILEGLSVPDLTAAVSTLVYDSRGMVIEPFWPSDEVRSAYARIRRAWRHINKAEEDEGVTLCREPDPGFVDLIWGWASGAALEEVLGESELSAGDFVRSAKQVWDLLRQLVEAAPNEALETRCREAAAAVYRGVVAYAGAI